MSSKGLKHAALISYVGTSYCGWQKQSSDVKGSAAEGSPSIQATIESALAQITQEEVSVVGSGRTDSGVHARGQVIHFMLKKREWDLGILLKAMNGVLPGAIQVQAIQHVPIEFHAQRSAEKKQYSYYYQQGPCALPSMKPFSWWIKKRLDQDAMREALGYLKGRHDFKPFQSRGAKPMLTTVREILEAEVTFEPVAFPEGPPLSTNEMGLVRVRIVGTGFLKQMVRGIAGTLLQVGEGRRRPDCMREILETLDRNLVGPTAPPRALWLERVWYPGLNW
jgi:tRNA pseudouridine38-40 synthase